MAFLTDSVKAKFDFGMLDIQVGVNSEGMLVWGGSIKAPGPLNKIGVGLKLKVSDEIDLVGNLKNTLVGEGFETYRSGSRPRAEKCWYSSDYSSCGG